MVRKHMVPISQHRRCRIRPILYRVAIEWQGESYDGIKPIRNLRNAQITGVAPFVRHLLVTSRSPHAHVIEMLSTFQNTENLAIWLGTGMAPKFLEKMKDLPLRMLSVGLGHVSLDEAIKYCPALRNITHLELSVTLKVSTWNDCKALVEFPKLTHLFFHNLNRATMKGAVLDLLKHCPSLRVMVYQSEEWVTRSDDPRFLVLQDFMCLDDAIEEWERSANGRIGLWELADIIINARKGEVHSFFYIFVFTCIPSGS